MYTQAAFTPGTAVSQDTVTMVTTRAPALDRMLLMANKRDRDASGLVYNFKLKSISSWHTGNACYFTTKGDAETRTTFRPKTTGW